MQTYLLSVVTLSPGHVEILLLLQFPAERFSFFSEPALSFVFSSRTLPGPLLSGATGATLLGGAGSAVTVADKKKRWRAAWVLWAEAVQGVAAGGGLAGLASVLIGADRMETGRGAATGSLLLVGSVFLQLLWELG